MNIRENSQVNNVIIESQ